MFLTWLADELRAAGLDVVEYSDWQTRARRSGAAGYTTTPLCVMEHHTASPATWDGRRDADYIATGDPDAPLANLYIERSGRVWVIAAGPTNTNGRGQAMTFSRGTVAADTMNTRAVGIECGNNGVGEPWPQAQIDALVRTANTVNRRLGNVAGDIAGHCHYAPTRKIDPATATAVQGPWRPRGINSSGSWDLEDMRAEHARRWEPEDDDMALTDADVERIARAVWQQAINDATTGQPQNAASLLSWARRDTARVSDLVWTTKINDAVTGAEQNAASLLSWARRDAARAAEP